MKYISENYAAIFSALVLLIAGAAVTANAQWGNNNRNWDGYPNWGGSYELRQTALNEGYNEGTRAGDNDRGRGRARGMNDFSAYRDATKGYNSRYGDRELYRRYFQLAFQNGYNTEMGIQNGGYNNGNYGGYGNNGSYGNNGNYGNNNGNYGGGYGGYGNGRTHRGRNWDQYGNYGGSYQLRQTALNAGYNDGVKQGRRDRGRNRYGDFYNNSDYRNATRDYNSRYGDEELYRRYYREGYENGYSDGYNGY